jgi:drug/metabolite transporter (DMT)-like permease
MYNRPGLGIACALGAAAMYGLIPNFVRGAFVNGVPPVESVFFRTAVLAVAFAVLAVMQGQSLRVPREALGSFLTQILATLLVSLGYLASVQFIPVGLAVILFFLFPVVIMLGSSVIERRSPGVVKILIAVFAFAGLAVAIGPRFDGLDIRGIALASVGSLGAALQFFSGRSISRHLTPSVFGFHVHLAVLPVVLGISLFIGGGHLQSMPGGTGNGTALLFMLGLGCIYVVAYLVQMFSLRFAPASTVAPFYNLEPVVTTALAAFILGERLQINQYFGGTMVLAALLASSLIDMRKAELE